MIGGDDDLLSDLPPLGEIGAKEEMHHEDVVLVVGEDEDVGLDYHSSGEDVFDPAELIDASGSEEGASAADATEPLVVDLENEIDAGDTEYGWAEFAHAPTDEGWNDDFQGLDPPPAAADADHGGESGLADESLDEPLSLPPLDDEEPDEPEDSAEDSDFEGLLLPGKVDPKLGLER